MDLVLTLIASPGTLGDDSVDTVRRSLAALGVHPGPPKWLALGEACDIYFDGLAPDQADAAARHALAGAPVDILVQPSAGRRKRLLVADMESTIIRQEMLDELGDLLGIRDGIAAITERAMNGEIDFAGAVRERVALLKGLPITALDEVSGRITMMPGAPELVAAMRANGARCILVSGGFRHFTVLVRQRLGFDDDYANDLEVVNGRLTGRPVEPILGRDDKLKVLVAAAAAGRRALSEVLAVGDGANDLPMLMAAGIGIAFHAKPKVRAEATYRIDHADLKALLYVQGYRREEIPTGWA